jgi:plasmid stability protein
MATSYTIRAIDEDLWHKVKIQAAKDGKPIRAVILELLTKYAK